ncbi:MAG TPA: hypothetical protein VFS21_23675 [Roseiflexaceae bacterium]|nr:hypothetical protein [Roseiflexaceae bacterium]
MMQISPDSDGSFIPTDGRRIIDRFVDYETGYLVVVEISLDSRADRTAYYTVVDRDTRTVITPQMRLGQIDSAEHSVVDREHNLKATVRRTVNIDTGQELLFERVIDLASGQEVMSRTSIGFSKGKRQTALESYLAKMENHNAMKRFWREEYPKKTLDERKSYWLQYIYHDMRVMGEVGQDVFGILSKDSYRDWKAKAPEIDCILDDLAEQLPRMWPGHDHTISQKIQAMRD